MKFIQFLIDNKDAILTFIFALVFRKIEKPRVEKEATKKILNILETENPQINLNGIWDKLNNYGSKK
jgi:hypothetical protein